MARYQQITIEGKAYDLSHLDSFTFEFRVPEKDGKPAQVYTIEAEFSWHCFTHGIKHGEKIAEALIYWHGREQRLFDERRYHLSKRLPEIIRNLGSRKCYHTGRGNYSKVEFLNDNDVRAEYAIFF